MKFDAPHAVRNPASIENGLMKPVASELFDVTNSLLYDDGERSFAFPSTSEPSVTSNGCCSFGELKKLLLA